MKRSSTGAPCVATACVLLLFLVHPAEAFRPFDGTDARVAERHLFELELSPMSYARTGEERSLVVPQVTLNFGVGSGLEFALEGRSMMRMSPRPEGTAPAVGDVELSSKKVLRPGPLRAARGPSIATEVAVNVPTGGQAHPGFGGGLIVSQPLSKARTMLHFTAELSRTQELQAARFVSMILEGPEAWPVRPVGELSLDRLGDEHVTRGYLAGIIWQTRQGLTMDAAVKALDAAEHGLELRTGFTWHMQLRRGR